MLGRIPLCHVGMLARARTQVYASRARSSLTAGAKARKRVPPVASRRDGPPSLAAPSSVAPALRLAGCPSPCRPSSKFIESPPPVGATSGRDTLSAALIAARGRSYPITFPLALERRKTIAQGLASHTRRILRGHTPRPRSPPRHAARRWASHSSSGILQDEVNGIGVVPNLLEIPNPTGTRRMSRQGGSVLGRDAEPCLSAISGGIGSG